MEIQKCWQWKELFRWNKKTFFIVFWRAIIWWKIKIWWKIADTSFQQMILYSLQTKEMMGVVIGYFDEFLKSLIWDFISLVSVSSTKSEILIEKIKEIMMNCGIVITRTRFVCFNGTNSMSCEKSGVQRHYQNDAPFSIYVNCRCHRLLYTKLLIGFKILYYLSWSR